MTRLLKLSTSKFEFVFQFGGLDLAGAQVEGLDLLALGELDAVLAEQGLVADGRLVVDEPVVGHGLAVRVGEDRACRRFRWCGAPAWR